jgi:hypothetical protein
MPGYELEPTAQNRDAVFEKLNYLLDSTNNPLQDLQEIFPTISITPPLNMSLEASILSSQTTLTVTEKNTNAQISITIDRPTILARTFGALPKVTIEPIDFDKTSDSLKLAARFAANFSTPSTISPDIEANVATDMQALYESKRKVKKGLEGLTTPKLSTKETPHKALETIMRDRGIAREEDFTNSSRKSSGLSAGYVGTEKASKHQFMLKQFYKTIEPAKQMQKKERNLVNNNRRDGVRELIGSTLYQFLLYDSAPKEQLVLPDAQHQDSLYVRSKFFNNSKTMLEWRIQNPHTTELEGFEKAIAACNLLGEVDYHAGNLMVETADGKKTTRKIDHGRSFMLPATNFKFIAESTNHILTQSKHDIYVKFNVAKYSKAVNQMLLQLTPDQVDQIVNQKIDELKKAGFDPEGMTLNYYTEKWAYIDKPITNFEDLRSTIAASIKANLEGMKDVALKVDVIAKFDPSEHVSQKFKDGEWLKEFKDGTDPILYALNKGITIEKLNPIAWAQKNNYPLDLSATSAAHAITTPKEISDELQELGSEKFGTGLMESEIREHEPAQDQQQPQTPTNNKKLATEKEVTKTSSELRTELVLVAFDKDLPSKLNQTKIQELQKLITQIPNSSSPEEFPKHAEAIKTWIKNNPNLDQTVRSKLESITSSKAVDKSRSTHRLTSAPQRIVTDKSPSR